MMNPEDVLAFWLDEVGPQGWYKSDPATDAKLTEMFHGTWVAASEGALSLWLTYPTGTLAYCILTDQFPRNMFRNSAQAFATDGVARAAAKSAISKGWDLRIDEPARVFFYMPMTHSECLADQERSVRLIHTRMPAEGAGYLRHAKAHREIIRKFGRFPYRNDALNRMTQPMEAAFLADGGYGAAVRELEEAT